MNKQRIILSALLITFLTGCATVKTVTDTVTLYPSNDKAQKWGVIRFYRQYRTDSDNKVFRVELPNGKKLEGQLTYLERSGSTTFDDGFNGRVTFGIGHSFGSHAAWGINLTPQIGHYRSDIAKVSLNAFGEGLGLNCNGDYNRRQNKGILNCQITNGMTYRGNLVRVVVRQ